MFSKPDSGAITSITLAVCLVCSMFLARGTIAGQADPQIIPEELSCGKCAMFPASYPQWQSQVIFKDGTMSAFDGCKCMFGFIHNMSQFDTVHTRDDIAKIWVRDFNSGEWVDATAAKFVIGSSVMGPMGKELIPFKEQDAAAKFQQKNGGQLAGYDAITMETLKPLMGKMHMKGKMKMEGHMAQ